jgi:DNA-binding response OmpR family regulator
MVDPENYDARINGKFFGLTPTEIQIMYVFAGHLGELVTADELFDLVWGNDAAVRKTSSSSGKRRRIAVYVNRLRAKCRAETDAITFRTLKHVGYQLLVSRCDGNRR